MMPQTLSYIALSTTFHDPDGLFFFQHMKKPILPKETQCHRLNIHQA